MTVVDYLNLAEKALNKLIHQHDGDGGYAVQRSTASSYKVTAEQYHNHGHTIETVLDGLTWSEAVTLKERLENQ